MCASHRNQTIFCSIINTTTSGPPHGRIFFILRAYVNVIFNYKVTFIIPWFGYKLHLVAATEPVWNFTIIKMQLGGSRVGFTTRHRVHTCYLVFWLNRLVSSSRLTHWIFAFFFLFQILTTTASWTTMTSSAWLCVPPSSRAREPSTQLAWMSTAPSWRLCGTRSPPLPISIR